MDIKRHLRRWLRKKLLKKRSGNIPLPMVDDAIDWMLSKPIWEWRRAYWVLMFDNPHTPAHLEFTFQWLYT